MRYIDQALQAHPMGERTTRVADTIGTLIDNAATCHVCSDACLHEDMVKDLIQCIERDNECAAACEATAKMLVQAGSSNQRVWSSQLNACAQACASCAEENEKHARMHEHCRINAESCRNAESACRQASSMVESLVGMPIMA